MKRVLTIGLILALASAVQAEMVISEWMYSGNDGEFIEFTNVGTDAMDLTGWSYDDDSQVAGTVDLSAFGTLAAGQSVILTEIAAADFATAWGLTDVAILGDNSANLGRADTINLFDAGGNLVDQLAYGDQVYSGTVRTQNASCNIPAADYGFVVVQTSWVLASVGDAYGSWASANGDVASPGIAPIPEPAALTLLLVGGWLVHRCR